ncbi:hexon assembly protein [Equine adenovirus 1]|uniref:Shutoff protein n=1 Tax=Equine adenovirus A serotype 1 TaxID=46916 RepID=G5CZ89_ADEE1|nr:hexon assembly protein [Equine adenovirus 1]AEP16420.1 hexon assembly protein [Equine adenovirus 1]
MAEEPVNFTPSEDSGLVAPPNSPLPDAEKQEQEPEADSEGYASEETALPDSYLDSDVLLKHLHRQCTILQDALSDRWVAPTTVAELTAAYERALFCPKTPPKKQDNGTCENNPRLNFYPTFAVPETLAAYHIFFTNQRVPLSCRANRPRADAALTLSDGDRLPDYETMETVSKIFEGLNGEELADNAVENHESVLVELKGDSPRLAVVKRGLNVTHFAYPAVHLPPKVISTVMDCLLTKRAQPSSTLDEVDPAGGEPVVSDAELARWLGTDAPEALEAQRKNVMGAVLVTVLLECMQRFFTSEAMVRKIGESLHYTFRHGYVALASKISNVELTNVITYMGILHENRLGQNILHNNIRGEAKRDYIRDTIYLALVHSWQSAMGIWQQCLEAQNLKELVKLLQAAKKRLWSNTSQRLLGKELADILFPPKLLQALHNGLPDIVSQSMMQNFRSFVLERSGILPAVCCPLPTDFVCIAFDECPPTLWAHTYLFKLANYFMYHNDICFDVSGEGLLEYYCRCNLCTPHRCLATNTPLLNETQLIGTFDIRGPGGENGGESSSGLKLTAGMWTSAFLQKFEPADYHAHTIRFYENQSKPPAVDPSACVITQSAILGQLQTIRKAREEFLLKKGQGVYLDPQTGEPLNEAAPCVEAADHDRAPVARHGGAGGGRASHPRRHNRHRGGGGGGRVHGPPKPPRLAASGTTAAPGSSAGADA